MSLFANARYKGHPVYFGLEPAVALDGLDLPDRTGLWLCPFTGASVALNFVAARPIVST
ncbi:MAG: hypothetical protein OWS74_07405 [Firmicutes bacterium]|nr:hypothetical protein [Bacillota bacterium]